MIRPFSTEGQSSINLLLHPEYSATLLGRHRSLIKQEAGACEAFSQEWKSKSAKICGE